MFKLFKKKNSCSCNCGCKTINNMNIKILGSGCKNCQKLADNVEKALNKLEINAKVEHITDLAKISSYGVMLTPALMVDEKIVSSGQVLSPKEIVKILEQVK